MDYVLTVNAKGQLELADGKITGALNNIILSLAIAKGSWWFDPDFGSELHLLRRTKATAASAEKAKSYIEAALRWLIAVGKLSSISVVTECADRRIKFQIEARQPDGNAITYSNFVEVS